MLAAALAVAAGALATRAASAVEAEPAGELAYVRNGTIHVARTDGTDRRAVTRGFTPAWSPDGTHIVFSRSVAGNSDLYVADASGANVRRLTRTRASELTPAWSPDGARITYVSNAPGRFDLYVMRANGGGVSRILAGRKRGDSFLPAWSPDGRLIAFSSSAWTPENPEIYVVRPDGTGLRRMTRTKGGVHVLGDDSWPRWSPDGRRIAFTSNRTGNGEVWIMRADGGGQKRIAGLPRRDDWAPAFSPDGRWLAFHSLAQARSDLYLVRPDGTGLRRLGIAGSDAAFRPQP
jgi:TolB protein